METDNGNSSRKSGKVFSDKGDAAPKAEGAYQLSAGSRKRKQKSLTLNVRTDYFPTFNCKIDGFSISLHFLSGILAYSSQVRNILFVAE